MDGMGLGCIHILGNELWWCILPSVLFQLPQWFPRYGPPILHCCDVARKQDCKKSFGERLHTMLPGWKIGHPWRPWLGWHCMRRPLEKSQTWVKSMNGDLRSMCNEHLSMWNLIYIMVFATTHITKSMDFTTHYKIAVLAIYPLCFVSKPLAVYLDTSLIAPISDNKFGLP